MQQVRWGIHGSQSTLVAIEKPLHTEWYQPDLCSDNLQMSKPLAGECCDIFLEIVHRLCSGEYLHVPDECDIKDITNLHKKVHCIQGMLVSLLECMHTSWKNSRKP
jgi:hypothetical protein